MRRPKEPNLRRMPAKTIEPPTGASTCALGSHVCSRYMGVLTTNLTVTSNVNRTEPMKEGSLTQTIYNSRGRLLITVYKSNESEACNFSGWYPYKKTIKVIGSTLIS